MKPNSDRISVLLTTEGTYPFSPGGVSTWCDILLNQLQAVDYTVFSVTMDPFVAQKYRLPTGATLIKVPLWGTEEPSEHLDQLFSSTYLAKQRTVHSVVSEEFLPLFRNLVMHIISVRKDPFESARLVARLHDFFTDYDYKVAFKSHLTWNAYKELILEAVQDQRHAFSQPDLYCMIQSLGWIYRFFNIINTPIPQTTVTHSSAAAFCGLPCVISKVKYGTPFLLTEHGIYIREQYLSLSKRGYPSFLNTFLMRLIHTVTEMNYAMADQISPVCEYNTRWERLLTDRPERIEVIYNGVDHHHFTRTAGVRHDRPTVVSIARIDPIKDNMTLIRAAAVVKKAIPNVRFLLYGAVSVQEYQKRCERLVDELSLRDTVEFRGHTNDMTGAYESGDVVAQSSISEAFPYSVVEAMLSGKAIVSTDVGGIPEALGNTGILVPPRDAEALANGLIQLLTNAELCRELSNEAYHRALTLFTLERSLERYLKTYIRLSVGAGAGVHSDADSLRAESPVPISVSDKAQLRGRKPNLKPGFPRPGVLEKTENVQQLWGERAYAMLDLGRWDEAADLLTLALAADPQSLAAPVLLADFENVRQKMQGFDDSERILKVVDQKHRDILIRRQQLAGDRALAFADQGLFPEALGWLCYAASILPDSPAVPVFCLEMSRLFAESGDAEEAQTEMEKFYLVSLLQTR